MRTVTVEASRVTRPAMPWAATVHELLRHLRCKGLPVPEPISLNERVETLTLVPGVGGDERWPGTISIEAARSMGALLRRLHDASTDFAASADARWVTGSASQVERAESIVVCHGDPKPGNMAWEGEQAIGIFDFDDARPAPRRHDVAYALKWIIPLNGDVETLRTYGPNDHALMRARASAFLEGYGWSELIDIATEAVNAHEESIAEVELLANEGIEPARTWVGRGETAAWRAELPELSQIAQRVFGPGDGDSAAQSGSA